MKYLPILAVLMLCAGQAAADWEGILNFSMGDYGTPGHGIQFNHLASNGGNNDTDYLWNRLTLDEVPGGFDANASVLFTLRTEALNGFPYLSGFEIDVGCGTATSGQTNFTLQLFEHSSYSNETVTWRSEFGEILYPNCSAGGALLEEIVDAGQYAEPWFFNSSDFQSLIKTNYQASSPTYLCIQIVQTTAWGQENSVDIEFWRSTCGIGAPGPANIELTFLGYNTTGINGTDCAIDSDCPSGGILQFCNQVSNICTLNNVNVSLDNRTADGVTVVDGNWTDFPTVDFSNFTWGDSISAGGDQFLYSGAVSNHSDSFVRSLDFTNYYQAEGFISGGAKVAQSYWENITLPECTGNLDCPSLFACNASYQCEPQTEACAVDGDCGASDYCETYSQEFAFCEALKAEKNLCYRDHECVDDNCTADVNNTEFGDYPQWEDYGFLPYDYLGYCTNENMSGCVEHSDCNQSVDFCYVPIQGSFVEPPGYCETLRGEDEYCLEPPWCAAGLDCVEFLCTNVSVNGTNQCNVEDWYGDVDDKIFFDCAGQGACGDDGSACYCGQQVDNGTYLCLDRSPLTGACRDLVNTSVENEDRCDISLQCMGFSCVPNAWECSTNPTCPSGNLLAPGDQYCPLDDYCDTSESTPLCLPRIFQGGACAVSFSGWQCESCDCGVSATCTSEGGGLFSSSLNVTILTQSSDFTLPAGTNTSIEAAYLDAYGSPITGATCQYSSTGTVTLNRSFLYLESIGYHTAPLRAKPTPGVYDIIVYCSSPDYNSATIQETLTLSSDVSGNETTRIRWRTTPPDILYLNGVGRWEVQYERLNTSTGSYIHVRDAACSINFYRDGAQVEGDTFLQENAVDGYNYLDFPMYFGTGPTEIIIACSADGLESQDISSSFIVYSDHCENQVQDAGESGVDCGGTCPPCVVEPDHCENGIEDETETGIDCGGGDCNRCSESDSCSADRDCLTGWCDSGVCRQHSCYDGIRNGDEDGIDCGGGCTEECWCALNNDCTVDGSAVCSCGNFASCFGSCERSSCSGDEDCLDVRWLSGGVFVWRGRVCDTGAGLCYFGERSDDNQTIKRNETLSLAPLSGLIANVSGARLFMSNCEEENNGLIAVTEGPTQKHYLFVSSSFSPAISTDLTYKQFGGAVVEAVTSALVPEYCAIPTGDDRIYSRTIMYACGNTCRDAIVDTLTFREKFKVNISTAGDNYNLTLNRNGSCYSRKTSTHPYVLVGENGTLFTADISNGAALEWLCNSTFSEEATGTYPRTLRSLGWWMLTGLIMFLIHLVSPNFAVQTWHYTILILVIPGIFLVVLVALEARRRSGAGGGGYDRGIY